jgi:hypothetical protein
MGTNSSSSFSKERGPKIENDHTAKQTRDLQRMK